MKTRAAAAKTKRWRNFCRLKWSVKLASPRLSVLNQLILIIEGLRRMGKSIRMVTKTEEVRKPRLYLTLLTAPPLAKVTVLNPKTIKEAATRLSDSKSYSWKLRLSAIEWLQNLVKDVEEHDQIVMSLVMLSNPLIAQCRDLRSAIVRETCNLLKLFASNLGDRFASIAPAITKHLLMITGGGNKVIAGYCGECAQEIVKNTQSKKSIALFVSLSKSRSKVVREKSLMCLCICLEVWSPTNWLHNTKKISTPVLQGIE